MYDMRNLKDQIEVSSKDVECPVQRCMKRMARQRGHFTCAAPYYCSEHDIFVSPSTFEYRNKFDNLLWKGQKDLDLLARICAVKRESRMARERSEDAVTWNVFRYLERSDLLGTCVSDLVGARIVNPRLVYWSCLSGQEGVYELLRRAREEFELRPAKGSEPDLIIEASNAVVIIEAKLGAVSRVPPPANPRVQTRYQANRWWGIVFRGDFHRVVVAEKRYEVARFWLLGSWMAQQTNKSFYLVVLMPSLRDPDLESDFGPLISQREHRSFLRRDWERIYQFLLRAPGGEDDDRRKLLDYFRHKTAGYRNCKLSRAFNIGCEVYGLPETSGR